MKRKTKLLLCLLLSMLLTGCCSHEWEEANCEQPRTCVECGKEEGEKGDHDWEKATCEHPKTCSVCGKEKGDIGDHKWKDATCTEPETCRYCGETRGQAAGHRWAGLTCQECGETRENPAATAPAVEAPAAEAPAADDGSLDIYPVEFLMYMLDYASNYSDSYFMGEVLEDSYEWYTCYLDYQQTPAYKVIMLLDKQTGCIDRVTMLQLKADIPGGDGISLYTAAVAMGVTDPDDLQDLYQHIDANMTSQDIREDMVYEIFEPDGYYIAVAKLGTEAPYIYEVEVFRPTVF